MSIMNIRDICEEMTGMNEDDMYSSWNDDPEIMKAEITHEYMEAVSHLMMGSGDYLETLYDFSKGMIPEEILGRLNKRINTFPFGEPTDKIYPEFFGICAGKQTLTSVLKAADAYMNKADNASVTILTDKWDPKAFARYEGRFLDIAIRKKILINIFLVTNYGMTRIPFLNRRKIDEYKRRYGNVVIENQWGRRCGSDIEMVVYKTSAYHSFRQNADLEMGTYIFNFKDNKASYVGNDGKTFLSYKLDEIYAERFLAALDRVIYNDGIYPGSRPTCYNMYEMRVHFKDGSKFDRIVWYNNHEGVEPDPVNDRFFMELGGLLNTMEEIKE